MNTWRKPQKNETAEPGATAQRPQLSRPVRAHVSRQLGSWLIWDVGQIMSNRTWVCVDCGKSYRRDQTVKEVRCALCAEPCEYVHWKIHIPSPKKKKEWGTFWAQYREEKRVIDQFNRDPNMKEVYLPLLNQKLMRPATQK